MAGQNALALHCQLCADLETFRRDLQRYWHQLHSLHARRDARRGEELSLEDESDAAELQLVWPDLQLRFQTLQQEFRSLKQIPKRSQESPLNSAELLPWLELVQQQMADFSASRPLAPPQLQPVHPAGDLFRPRPRSAPP